MQISLHLGHRVVYGRWHLVGQLFLRLLGHGHALAHGGLSIHSLANPCGISPNVVSGIKPRATSSSAITPPQLATAPQVPITLCFRGPGEQMQIIRSRAGERPFSGSTGVLRESPVSGLVCHLPAFALQ